MFETFLVFLIGCLPSVLLQVGDAFDGYEPGVLEHGPKMVLLNTIIEESLSFGDKILVFRSVGQCRWSRILLLVLAHFFFWETKQEQWTYINLDVLKVKVVGLNFQKRFIPVSSEAIEWFCVRLGMLFDRSTLPTVMWRGDCYQQGHCCMAGVLELNKCFPLYSKCLSFCNKTLYGGTLFSDWVAC